MLSSVRRRLGLSLVRRLAVQESQVLATALSKLVILWPGQRLGSLPSKVRVLVDASQLTEPLDESGPLPPIEILVVCHSRDFETTALAIQGAVHSSRNPVSKIRLVVPDTEVDEASNRFPSAHIERESMYWTEALDDSIQAAASPGRAGWLLQQYLKFRAVMESSERGTLVVDADTILTRPRLWLDNNGTQLLSMSHEYHLPYELHRRAFWPGTGRPAPVSFVTHHQLMQRRIVLEMFRGDAHQLVNWIRLADSREPSALSEYHCYGSYLLLEHPSAFRFARWGNVSRSRRETNLDFDLDSIRSESVGGFSVSLHHYL